ncbi:hypothetical protein M3936_19345 [Sutcliffiella horikoshii]|uniref:hypothetical protein n=1 Tax=Sutcliffiella horikoshii TaxID=79883 RepID=UPI001CBEB0B1|nr:hypothetical protein [Sutcliffiella horikoshii]MCM3619729.1 hypothetical protein [Sutcliffiella horikoshii]UAL49747.1 hypothetical protein K7887_22535 [Sutcliffiella horikoshii]
MKKMYVLVSVLCLILTVGCSSSGGGAKASIDPQLDEALNSYQTFLTNTLNESNGLLNRFNTLVDNLYVQDISSEQFSKVVKEIIKDSSALVKQADGQDYYHQNLQAYHTSYLSYLNQQHQLFLDSIEMANKDRLDKAKLRQNYLKIKDSQSAIINSWGTAAGS